MSFGLSPPPFDPDDPEGLRQVAPPAPLPAVAPPPVVPPPAGIAGVNADQVAGDIGAVGQPPATPAAPSGPGLAGLDVGKVAGEIAAASKPPVGAPTTAPAAAPAPGSPPAPAASAEAAAPPDALSELKKAQAAESTAREASVKANEELQKAQAAGVEANQKLADQKVKDEQEAQRQRAEIAQRYQAADTAAQQQIQQTHDAIKNFKFRDYFSDGKEGTDWARKIGISLATALGAFGAGLTRGPNYALQILNKDMDDAHQAQVAELGRLRDDEVTARTGLQDVGAARQKALADLTVADAARDRLIAAQLEQTAARQKTAEFAPGLVAAAQKLRLEAAEKDTAAKKQLVELNVKLADESRKGKLDDASIAEKESLTKLHNAQTAAGGFAPRHGKAGAGGGGPGVGGDAVSKLKAAIEAGKDGRALTAGEIQDVANGLKIPAFAKAGHPSVEAITKSVAFVKGQGTKEQDATDRHHRVTERDAALQVTGGNGDVLGVAKSPKEATELNKSNRAFEQLQERTKALIDDIKTNGARVLLPDATQRRNSLAGAVVAAGRVYNGLSATAAGQKLEHDILGASGTVGNGLLVGANLGVVQHLLDEAETQHNARLNIALRAGSQPGGKPAGTPPAAHAEQPVGATRVVKGKTYRKTGPNQWEAAP